MFSTPQSRNGSSTCYMSDIGVGVVGVRQRRVPTGGLRVDKNRCVLE